MLESFQSPLKYLRKYRERNNGHFSKYHAYAFDGVWVIAKAVHAILNNETATKTDVPSHNGVNQNLFRGDLMSVALNETNFRGVTVSMLQCPEGRKNKTL